MNKNFIEIKSNQLTFNFGKLNEIFSLTFQRTLRIPDDNKKYQLPPSLGSFPLLHVEDFSNVPQSWKEHGGIFMPMYQAEAMWMRFSTPSGRPFAVKVASGKVNAVSGKTWENNLKDNGKETADYMVAPKQPWLDGFNVGKDVIRQFVAVPLESGYTVEEQVTGKAEHGGIQIIVYPMKDEYWNRMQQERPRQTRLVASSVSASGAMSKGLGGAMYMSGGLESAVYACSAEPQSRSMLRSAKPDMGLGAGGMMTQQIFEDEFGVDAWDQENGLRVFVHLANSDQYEQITGKKPPTAPIGPDEYRRHNYPWFEYYSDSPATKGSEILSKIDSIASMQNKKGETILPNDGHKPKLSNPIIFISDKKIVDDGTW